MCAKCQGSNVKIVPWAQKVNFQMIGLTSVTMAHMKR